MSWLRVPLCLVLNYREKAHFIKDPCLLEQCQILVESNSAMDFVCLLCDEIGYKKLAPFLNQLMGNKTKINHVTFSHEFLLVRCAVDVYGDWLK